MFLVNYSSSSESEDDKSEGKVETTKVVELPKTEANR